MSPERPNQYEQLTLEAAARVDAACDGFEQAWKAARTGAAAPQLSDFLDSFEGPERTILAGELAALEQACRKRYGPPTRPDDPKEFGAEAEGLPSSPTRLLRGRCDVPGGQPADWPHVPGLELVEALGSGGMGVVFKARQTTLGRDVAVKFLRDAHAADWEQRERFLQEARAVARLRHPNLVQLYEFGEAPTAGGTTSQPYLVLEYVPGGSLADLMRGSPQRPKEAARLVETLAQAIHYAHQQGVIHRDLKPANVLLQRSEVRDQRSEEGSQMSKEGGKCRPKASDLCPLTSDLCPKVTDFGLAKFLAGSDLTQTGDVLGTPGYMAPEQASSKFGSITAAVDVYGLGAILYEALTGRPPFQAETAPATVYQVQHEDPVTPRRLQPTIPSDLDTICLKCLRKEPGRRYATAQNLADDLRRFQGGEPIRARPVGSGERIVVWCRRKPAVAGLLAALVLVFLAGSSGVLWQWQRATESAAKADRNAAKYKAELETAQRRQKLLRERVDGLTRRGYELYGEPGQYNAGKALLEEALTFYDKLLPEDARDPLLRVGAANTYDSVGRICHLLGQWDRALEAFDHSETILRGLLEEEPANKGYCRLLANNYRYRANVLRDVDRMGEAREAYDQAARIHEQLHREEPSDMTAAVNLANTLDNMTSVLSLTEQAQELEDIFARAVDLDRTALKAGPQDPWFQSELAVCLEDQAIFFLDTGRYSQALSGAREVVKLRQNLFDSGKRKSMDDLRYLARSYSNLGKVLAATGAGREAEQSFRVALTLLEPLVKDSSSLPFHRAELADTLVSLANLLDDPSRRLEVEVIRRQVIRHYERLSVGFPQDPHHRRNLVGSYLKLVSLLWELDRQTEAAEPYRKALAVDPEDPEVNNALAWFLATCGKPRLRDASLAVRLATKAVADRPKSAGYMKTLGVAHYRYGDDKAAIAELEKAMTLRDGGDSFDWFFLAMAYGRLGESDKARMWFKRAVQWMDNHKPHDDELRRFRAEAEATMTELYNRKDNNRQ
jgi:serine/threonine protein kinase